MDRLARRPAASALILVVVLAGAPLVASWATGALSVPTNDDWAYYRIATGWLETGRLRLVGWNEMTLIGQLVLSLPFLAAFGSSVAVVHVLGSLATAAVLALTYGVLRRVLDPGWALGGTALVGLLPAVAVTGPSFMTDMPALAAQLGCLLLGLRALDAGGRSRTWLLVASALAGFVAFTIRESSIAAPLAVLAATAYPSSAGAPARRAALATGGALLAACGIFYAWRLGLSGGRINLSRESELKKRLGRPVLTVFTLAFILLPALLLASRALIERLPRRTAVGLAAAVAVVGVGTFVAQGSDPNASLFLGTALERHGELKGEAQLGRADGLLPDALWLAVTALAIAAGVLLAWAAWILGRWLARGLRADGLRSARPEHLALLVFGGLNAAVVGGRLLTGGIVYDRYLVPIAITLLVPLALLARRAMPPARWRWPAIAALGLSALLAALVLSEALPLRVARWEAGRALVVRGYRAADVDAGFEWVGFHYRRALPNGGQPRRWAPPEQWYGGAFPLAGNCVVVAASPQREPWMHLLAVRSYAAGLTGSRHSLLLYRNDRGCARARVEAH